MTSRLFFRIFIDLFVAALAYFLFLRYLEAKMLFIPSRQMDATPAAVHLPYQEVSFQTKDSQVIRAWSVPGQGASRGTIYFLHGNAGNMGSRLDKIVFFHKLGFDVFILDYRGYGQSTGRPSERGLYWDAEAGYDALVSRTGRSSSDIILYGESLGGAVAVELALKKNVTCLILEGGFTSLADLSRQKVPLVPVWTFCFRFDSLSKIRNLDVPVLVLHSREDEVVPFSMGRKLFEASRSQEKYFVVLSGGHNSALLNDAELSRRKIDAFVSRIQN